MLKPEAQQPQTRYNDPRCRGHRPPLEEVPVSEDFGQILSDVMFVFLELGFRVWGSGFWV